MPAPMIERAASCHCRALRLACRGEPRKVSMCHCHDCQRRSGSAFSVAVFYLREQIRIEGETSSFERDSASGHPVRFHFCPICGSNLFWEPARLPQIIGVALGGFADPGLAMPTQSVFTQERHHWVSFPTEIACFDALPERISAS